MMQEPNPVSSYFADLAFELEAAKQDRILLDVRGWVLEGSLDQFSLFSSALSEAIEFPEGTHRLFTSQSGNMSWSKWPIAGGEQKGGTRLRDGTPLFTGSLNGRSPVQQVARSVWQLHAKLALNPTRWVRSQPYVTVDAASVDEWRQSPVRMFANEGRFRFEGEKPLERGTNVIIGPRMGAMARPFLWPHQLRRYHEAVLETLDHALAYAINRSGMVLKQRELTYSLREIETYWEFPTEHPLDEVRAIEMPLRSLASKSHVRWRAIAAEALGKLEVGTSDNSPVLRLKLEAGTEARIYAKTTRRVRFEVVRRTKQRREPFTAISPDRFIHWADDAAIQSKFTNIWEAYRTQIVKSSPAQFPKFRLITDIFGCLKGSAASWDIVSLLAHTGMLVRNEGTPFASTIDRLKAQHIIERVSTSGRDQIYHVTAQYQSGLDAIRMAL